MKQPSEKEITLDDAIAAVREQAVPAVAAAGAAARVWKELARETGLGEPVASIRGCADVQTLLSAHRRGELRGPQALLVEDHLHECAICRAADRQPDSPRLAVLPWRPAAPPVAPRRHDFRRYAVAAAVLLAVGLLGVAVQQVFFAVPTGSRAAVQSLRGALQLVSADGTRALAPGDDVGEGEAVRTVRGSQALLRLRDGSLVEMGERAELSVSARGQDTTIHLGRGNVIVQAAKRRSGHLLVSSRDCTVYVTGTVFSVNSGLKGSRVSVIEGHVRVVQDGSEKSLQAGDQLATSPSMGAVPLREEIAWSRDLDRHLALLSELKKLGRDFEAVRMPGLRYESRLLPLVSDQAVVYASLPNYGEAFGEAYQLFEARLGQSPVLREWWDQADPKRHGGPSLAETIEKVRSFADYLGDEVVFTAVDAGGRARPLLLAEIKRQGLREFLEDQLASLDGPGKSRPVLLLDEDGLTSARRSKDAFVVLVTPTLLAVGDDVAALQGLAERVRDAGPGLEGTPFGRRIAQAYEEGVGLLFAADLERMARAMAPKTAHTPNPSILGVEEVRHLIVESKQVTGQTLSQAVITFAGPRRGVASWLGAPAPMASLEFVSAGAAAVGSIIVKSPALLLDDVLAAAAGAGESRPFAEVEARLNLRLREDVAEALGGEFTLALDGPLLPTPAWKVIAEVYDPARLQSAVQSLVNAWNEEAARKGQPGLRLEAEQSDSRTYYALLPADAGFPVEVHYVFADGYLVAAGSRALVMRAIQVREGGHDLAHSAGFRSLLPADDHTNVSALLYQNFGRLANGLVDKLGSRALTPDQRGSFLALAGEVRPALVYAYGEESRIQVAGAGGLFGLDLGNAALPIILERLIQGTPALRNP